MLGACEAAGDLGRAQQWLRVIDEFTERYGCPFMYATCRTHYGGLLMAKGRWDQAERELAAAIRMSGAAGPVPHALALTQLAELRLRQGRLEEAEALLPDCHSDLLEGRVRLARGELAVAVRLLERCAERAGDTPGAAACLSVLVQAQLAARDLGGGESTVRRLEALAAGQASGYLDARTALAVGRLALARGRHQEAITALHAALDGFLALELPMDAALTRLGLARAYAPGRPEIAVAQARGALAGLDELGAAGADEAAALLRSLGAPARSAPRGHGAGHLTKREREVLQLMALGLSNPEIAGRLVISRKTAAHHVSRVLAKLGVRNRAEAIAQVGRQAVIGERMAHHPHE
jgi:ATP/maltotriose-dependent transcriptional regulator MalT